MREVLFVVNTRAYIILNGRRTDCVVDGNIISYILSAARAFSRSSIFRSYSVNRGRRSYPVNLTYIWLYMAICYTAATVVWIFFSRARRLLRARVDECSRKSAILYAYIRYPSNRVHSACLVEIFIIIITHARYRRRAGCRRAEIYDDDDSEAGKKNIYPERCHLPRVKVLLYNLVHPAHAISFLIHIVRS